MLVLLSPSKTQDFTPQNQISLKSEIIFKQEVDQLIAELEKLSIYEISNLMDLSEKLSKLNHDRFQDFEQAKHKQAILAYDGDVYGPINAYLYSNEQINFAQNTIRIISGLYGLLKPFDLIKPYRLEMKIKLKNLYGKDLYQFWGDKITKQLETDYIINLASNEYFSAINPKALSCPIITPIFKDQVKGTYKIVAIYAKHARGLMADYIIKNQITNPEALKEFNVEGYEFQSSNSDDKELVFYRKVK